jgi:hypothetical protein
LPNGKEVEQLLVPVELRREIVNYLYSSKVGGHMGFGSLTSEVRRRFYWPGYREDIDRWTKDI